MQYPLPIDLPDFPQEEEPMDIGMKIAVAVASIYVFGLFIWRWRNEKHDKSP